MVGQNELDCWLKTRATDAQSMPSLHGRKFPPPTPKVLGTGEAYFDL